MRTDNKHGAEGRVGVASKCKQKKDERTRSISADKFADHLFLGAFIGKKAGGAPVPSAHLLPHLEPGERGGT